MAVDMHVLEVIHHVDLWSMGGEIVLYFDLRIVDPSFHITFYALPAENEDLIVRDTISCFRAKILPIRWKLSFFLEKFDSGDLVLDALIESFHDGFKKGKKWEFTKGKYRIICLRG